MMQIPHECINRIPFDNPKPLTAHILLNTECNLGCDGCFYRKREPKEIRLQDLTLLLKDLALGGVRSVAFGGGEPMLYSMIDSAVAEARSLGLYVAVTTNPTTRHVFSIPPDRIHVSYSAMHYRAIRKTGALPFDELKKALKFYGGQAMTIGINYIYENFAHFKLLNELTPEADTFTILLKKPVEKRQRKPDYWAPMFEYIKEDRERFWIDACLVKLVKGTHCRQGISSLSIDQNLFAHRCSNTERAWPYTTLKETWEQVKTFDECILSG